MHKNDEPLTSSPDAVEVSDDHLLREFAATGTDEAFARLVGRHVALVYSAAFRQTANHAMAQDVTQAVFIVLARKAPALHRETVLAGWLLRAVNYAVLDARKIDARRQIRENEATQMQLVDSTNESEGQWELLAPLLDEAIATLSAKDRNVVLLRFFEKKSFGEIGAVVGGNENSARVRAVRAVEKLRGFFRRRGVTVSAATLMGVLVTHAVEAAPPALGAALLAAGAAGGPPLAQALVPAVLRRFRWKRWLRVGVALALILLLAGVGTLVIRQRPLPPAPPSVVSAPRSLRETMIAIDRTFSQNDPNGFIQIIHFRTAEEERFKPVFTNYIRAESGFRRAMRRAFNVQQRTFDATFRELCLGQPAVLTNYIGTDRAATNVMTAKYPLHLVKVGEVWYWNWFDGLSREARDRRMVVLGQKAELLDELAGKIRAGTATNVVEILEEFRGSPP
jgi:RNA polymerase sigma factor (sigma-70 family)